MPDNPGSSPDLSDLTIVVLVHNRRDAVLRTLAHLRPLTSRGACAKVVDNASNDGSPDAVEQHFPDIEIIRLRENTGVTGFNSGVASSTTPLVMVLDDDAMPTEGVVPQAVEMLRNEPALAAIPLLPIDESTGLCEWGFALGTAARNRWPVMGCANIVRREAWERVGGYEPAFFLYRNDVDLALKLLGAGYDIYFDPAWTVVHDSPGFRRKSLTWYELATRNWIWLARRHGTGMSAISGSLLGWLWAHRTSGLRWRAHRATLCGLIRGVTTAPPPIPRTVAADGKAFRVLMRSRVRLGW